MATGGSRAAQRREKKRHQQQTSKSQPQTSNPQPQTTKKQQQKKKTRSRFDSDSDSDGDGHALGAPVPLPSLEQGRVRDFEAEQRADAGKITGSKRARAEQAQLATDQRKKHYREAKAEKIVWRKFDRENEAFERYYQQFLQLKPEEWKQFVASLKDPVPVHVRVNGNYRSLSEIVTGTLSTDFNVHGMPVKLPSGDEALVDFSPVSWADAGNKKKAIWKLTLDSKNLRKSEPLRDLSKYFEEQVRLGTLLRHEPAADILPAFLAPERGHKVLDLCGGGEHRAPMLMELLNGQSSADDDDEMTGSKTSPASALIINERDATSAANAVRALSRTLSVSREVVVTSHKPVEFPAPHTEGGAASNPLFDRVVCCAPCSRDGMVRQIPELWRTWSPSDALPFHTSQLHMLSRALELVKVGGRVVYSTRSLHPIENEAVVAEMLRRYTSEGDAASALELVDISEIHPRLRRSGGKSSWTVVAGNDNSEAKDWTPVESWEGATDSQRRTLRPTMWPPTTSERDAMHLERCARLLPHQNDTHGLFVAVITKVRDTAVATPAVAGPAVPPPFAEAAKKSKKAAKKSAKQLGGYSTMNPDKVASLASFFGLGLPNNDAMLMERTGFAKENRSIHLVSPGVAEIIDSAYSAGRRLVVHRAGVTALVRVSNSNIGASDNEFDVTDDGARALLPLVRDESKRVLSLEMDEFASLLETKQMWIKNASDSAREALRHMTEGTLVVALDDMEPAQTGDRDLVLVAHKRHNSYSLASNPAAIARVKALVAELHAEVDSDDNSGDDSEDGYESFDGEQDG